LAGPFAFLGVCSQLMRHTLSGYARSRLYLKRGGEAQQVPFDENLQEFPITIQALNTNRAGRCVA
jgi:hypothetical protein